MKNNFHLFYLKISFCFIFYKFFILNQTLQNYFFDYILYIIFAN